MTQTGALTRPIEEMHDISLPVDGLVIENNIENKTSAHL